MYGSEFVIVVCLVDALNVDLQNEADFWRCYRVFFGTGDPQFIKMFIESSSLRAQYRAVPFAKKNVFWIHQAC